MAAVNDHTKGVGDDAMHQATGRHPDEWFSDLDAAGATNWTHSEIARWLVDHHGVDGWWSQSITVRYEQARGMRLPGQQGDGTFSVSKSKTVPGDAETVLAAAVEVFGVLYGGPPASTNPTANYPTARWKLDGGESVLVRLAPKPADKASAGTTSADKTAVTLTHSGIVSAEHLETAKPALESGLERLLDRLS
ncbi:DUF4287 domain-containing protein [Ruicaihuangia caeni]|uniref:DUF4287 domain-containing protein n=1 Tax=Ruicaihuangia caeni TaxID=3042517 RepID=UPI00338FDA09